MAVSSTLRFNLDLCEAYAEQMAWNGTVREWTACFDLIHISHALLKPSGVLLALFLERLYDIAELLVEVLDPYIMKMCTGCSRL